MADRQQLQVGAENAPHFYVNSASVAQSQFDLRLVMGTVTVADAERVVTNVSHVVYMTIQHAKAFSDVLLSHIAKYEALNGPIVMPQLPESKPEE